MEGSFSNFKIVTKTSVDAQLSEARKLTDPAKRATELIKATRNYLDLGSFLECSKVLSEAEGIVGQIRNKVTQERLKNEIQKILKERQNAFMNRPQSEGPAPESFQQ